MKYFAIAVFSAGELFYWGSSNVVGQPAAPKRLVPIPEKELAWTVEAVRKALSEKDVLSVIELDLENVRTDYLARVCS